MIEVDSGTIVNYTISLHQLCTFIYPFLIFLPNCLNLSFKMIESIPYPSLRFFLVMCLLNVLIAASEKKETKVSYCEIVFTFFLF